MNQLIPCVLHAGVKPQVVHFAGIVFKVKEFAGTIGRAGLWAVVNTELVALFSPHGNVELGTVIATVPNARVSVHTDCMSAFL